MTGYCGWCGEQVCACPELPAPASSTNAKVPLLYQLAALELYKFQEATGCDIADELPNNPVALIAARNMREAAMKVIVPLWETSDELSLHQLTDAIAALPLPGE